MRRDVHPIEAAARTPGGRQDRFPGFDVLGQVSTWDDVTAGVVLARLGPPPDIRFFTPAEEATGLALFDRLLGQDAEPRIPVLAMVDARLCEAQTDGWRYADMPEDGEAFRRSFAALDAEAQEHGAAAFHRLQPADQGAVIQRVQDLGSDDWHGMPAGHVWSLWTRYACTAFYSHPFAWNEMGFGGPAYPRGYKNIGVGAREPWEVDDHSDIDPTRS